MLVFNHQMVASNSVLGVSRVPCAVSSIGRYTACMTERDHTENRLQARLFEAEQRVLRYRKHLRRDLLTWIALSSMLGALIGYGIATWLIDPVIVLACGGINA